MKILDQELPLIGNEDNRLTAFPNPDGTAALAIINGLDFALTPPMTIQQLRVVRQQIAKLIDAMTNDLSDDAILPPGTRIRTLSQLNQLGWNHVGRTQRRTSAFGSIVGFQEGYYRVKHADGVTASYSRKEFTVVPEFKDYQQT